MAERGGGRDRGRGEIYGDGIWSGGGAWTAGFLAEAMAIRRRGGGQRGRRAACVLVGGGGRSPGAAQLPLPAVLTRAASGGIRAGGAPGCGCGAVADGQTGRSFFVEWRGMYGRIMSFLAREPGRVTEVARNIPTGPIYYFTRIFREYRARVG